MYRALGTSLAFAFVGLMPIVSQAAVIGYWRFENSGNLGLDSGPNSFNLTNQGAAAQKPTAVATPFPNPVPQTSASNTGAANFQSTASNSGTDATAHGYLSIADQTAFNVQTFTIEAFVRTDDKTNLQTIAGQYDESTTQRAWRFFVRSSAGGGQFGMTFNNTLGTASSLFTSFLPSINTNYYVAATVEHLDINSSGGVNDLRVTYIYKDLTNAGSLVTEASQNLLDFGSILNSTGEYRIGDHKNSGAIRYFDGTIDEVRWSTGALAQSELLAVPEPASLSLLALGSMCLLGVARRRR